MLNVRYILFCLLSLFVLLLHAQENTTGGLSPLDTKPLEISNSMISNDSVGTLHRFEHTASMLAPFGVGSAPVAGPSFDYEFGSGGAIATWRSGMLYGSSSQVYNRMFGTSAHVGVGGVQTLGKHWTFNANLSLNKYSFADRFNTFGASGSATYDASRNVGFTVFGSYQSSPFFGGPTSLRAFGGGGGYMSLKTNNQKWGVDVGAQTFYDPVNHVWRNQPIVMPYYNLNGQKLGFDFGGLLYQVFRGLSESNNRHHNGPPVNGGTPATGSAGPPRMIMTPASPSMLP